MVLVSSISNFFINKTSQANKWMRKKYLLAVGQIYKMRKIHCNLFTFQLRNNALISLEIAFTYFNNNSNVVFHTFFIFSFFFQVNWRKNENFDFQKHFIEIYYVFNQNKTRNIYCVDTLERNLNEPWTKQINSSAKLPHWFALSKLNQNHWVLFSLSLLSSP